LLSSDEERALRWAREIPLPRPSPALGGIMDDVGEDLMSLWPYPAATVSVPCGGNPEPQWTQVCTDCAAVSDDCRVLGHGNGGGLAPCQASCEGEGGCTEINWSPTTFDCVLRACPATPATTPYPGYNVYTAPLIAMAVGIDPENFKIVLDAPVASDPFMVEVAARFKDVILWHPWGKFDRPIELSSVTVSVADTSVRQIMVGVDESYSLSFSPSCQQAFITAQTVFGARHALETFSQMVQAERLTGSYSVGAYFGLFNITDAPRFDTRGLMVDSARHWLNPNVLLSIMDALSYVKMNKIEVGFGIDWAYTLASDAFPNLTDSAYGPKGTHMFSRDTIKWLVQEANFRGIRM